MSSIISRAKDAVTEALHESCATRSPERCSQVRRGPMELGSMLKRRMGNRQCRKEEYARQPTDGAPMEKPSFVEFLACRKGASAVEMALTLPIALVFVVGIMEVAMVMFVTMIAEGGLREAARYGITGQAPLDGVRAEQIEEIVRDHTHGLIEISTTSFSTKVYPSFEAIGTPEIFIDGSNGHPANGAYDEGEDFDDINGNSQWDSDMGLAGQGVAGDVVLYELNYDWEFMTPVLTVFAGQDNKLNLTASIAVRNEPF